MWLTIFANSVAAVVFTKNWTEAKRIPHACGGEPLRYQHNKQRHLVFPTACGGEPSDLNLRRDEPYEYCLKAAIRLRQRVRNQLAYLDPEYKAMTISVDY